MTRIELRSFLGIRRSFTLLAAVAVLSVALPGARGQVGDLPDFGLSGLDSDSGGSSQQVTGSASIVPGLDGRPAQLAITARIAPKWHIYSLTQKSGGPQRSRIDLKDAGQFRLLGPFQATPSAVAKQYEFWPGVAIEEHESEVTWTAPIEAVPPASLDAVVVRGVVSGQVCSELCLDYKVPFEARLAAGAPQAAAPAARVQPVGSPTLQMGSVTVTGALDSRVVAAGAKVNLTLTLDPGQSLHIYEMADGVPDDPGAARPTLIVLDQRSGFQVGRPSTDQPIKEKIWAELDNRLDRYYEGAVTWSIPLVAPQQPGNHELQGYIAFQACSENACELPTGARFAVQVVVGSPGEAGATSVNFSKARYKQVSEALAAAAPWDGVQESVGAAGSLDGVDWSKAGSFLILAYLGGLILNVMPCVLPVIGIKIMSFVQQAGEHRSRILMLNVWYALGLISVFMVLAALAAFANLRWAEQFERPEVGIALAAFVFLFALSLLGVWEIPIPGLLGAGKAAEAAEREGPVGAFSKGVLTTILATPCTGPFMGAALAWAVVQPTPIIFATFGAMGLGMATPYLLIGAFPAMIRMLPRPGAWMETFKNVMGFVLLATVAWIFTFIKDEYRAATVGLLFGIWTACWWFGRTPLTAAFSRRATAGFTAVALAVVLGFTSFVLLVPGEQWEPYNAERLAEYQRDGVTVLIDFTARSCFTCQVNKKTALYTKATMQYMNQYGIQGLTADLTEDAPHIDQLMTDLGRGGGGIPFYAIFPGDGRPPITFDGLLTQGRLLEKLQEAGPSIHVSNPRTAMSPRASN